MPAPEPASAPASAAAPVKHKLNHSYVWLGALRIVPFVFVVAIASAGDALFELIDIYATDGSILIVLLALIAIVLVSTGIAMLVRFISYNYIWYEYSNEEFSFYSGIISKKRAHVPYQRIQSINQKATLFQRIAGYLDQFLGKRIVQGDVEWIQITEGFQFHGRSFPGRFDAGKRFAP